MSGYPKGASFFDESEILTVKSLADLTELTPVTIVHPRAETVLTFLFIHGV